MTLRIFSSPKSKGFPPSPMGHSRPLFLTRACIRSSAKGGTWPIPGFLLVLSFGLACQGPTDDCTGAAFEGLRLTVIDSSTGVPLSDIATVTVTQWSPPHDSRSGSLRDIPSPLEVAYDRPGRYSVSVTATGYTVVPQLKCDSYPLHTLENGGVHESVQRQAEAIIHG